jgi:hypothetical protein
METTNIYCPPNFRDRAEQMLSKNFATEIKHWKWFENIDDFESADGRHIGIYFLNWPIESNLYQDLDNIYSVADETLVFVNELHPPVIDCIRKFDRYGIAYYIAGFLDFQLEKANVNFWPDWFIRTICFYKEHKPSLLFKLNPYQVKPYTFDALLGQYRPNRTVAYDFIKKNNLNGIATYLNGSDGLGTNDSEWLWESDGIENFEEVKKSHSSSVKIKYYGYDNKPLTISQVIPIGIYNQSAYSLVCETSTNLRFITEKTVKPILARRLFITLGGQFHLEGLRSLGFKTFGSIIDESYDSIENQTLRVHSALEQLKWLCEQDQQDILNRCKDIVDHNFDLMYGKNWEQFNKLHMQYQFTRPAIERS